MEKFKDIDEYMASLPKSVQDAMQKLRKVIRESAPEAEETISYGMPAFKSNGVLVYFAAHKNHIGFYPTASGVAAFTKELSSYKWTKGTVQFPIDGPIPFDLVRKIVKFRVEEDRVKAQKKRKGN
jgi:uncharacterized protein YdhG (YjbR/CyaY superfamily)